MYSIQEMESKRYDHINYRLEFIKTITERSGIDNLTIQEDRNDKDIRKCLNKKVLDFNNLITKIGGKLLYIKSGSTGHTFRGLDPRDENSDFNYAVKIVAYPKRGNYGKLNDASRPENAELLILKKLSKFVVSNQTPHIILPICTFYSDIKPFLNLSDNKIVNNKKYDEFIERYNKKQYYENVSILISEWANGGDLLDHIRQEYENFNAIKWKVLCYQILSVLAVIHKEYPSFRHNDMKANNILIQKIHNRQKNNKFKYKINGQIYVVPNIDIQIKLWDFDFACIPGLVENTKVSAKWTDKINIKPEQNRYYDVHYFFNTLTRKGFFPQFWDEGVVPKELQEFVSRIIPIQYREGEYVSEKGRLLIDDEYLTPDFILKNDPYFNEFRRY